MSIEDFAVQLPGQVRFGRGLAPTVTLWLAERAERVLLVHGANPTRAQWLVDALKTAGLYVTPVTCAYEPDVALIEAGVAAGRAANVQAVVALGGGAVIDTGKAVAGLIPATGDVFDYLEVVGAGRALDAAPLAFAALPTTAGTGTEATYNSVIDVPTAKRKVSLRDSRLMADYAVIDPALTESAPQAVTLASGLDAITQVIEPYISVQATPFTDALCAPAIPAGLQALATLMRGEDADARDQMAWVSLSGGMALANAKLGAVHGLAGPLGGVLSAPHGAIAGTLLGPVLAMNQQHSPPAIQARLAQIAEWIGQALGGTPDQAFVRLADWAHEQGLPRLAAMGLEPAAIAAIAEAAMGSSSMRGNPVVLTQAQLETILQAA